MVRFFETILWLGILVTAAHADPVYFVSIAEVKTSAVSKYEKFVNAVQPIWSRHGMTVLARTRTIDAFGEASSSEAPTEVAILKAETREGFNAYISDPDYQAIKALRIGAVDRLIIMEANLAGSARLDFLNKLPTAASIFSTSSIRPRNANLTLDVTLVVAVKGKVDRFFDKVKTVELFGVSYDDNPTAFVPEGGAKILGLVGEMVR